MRSSVQNSSEKPGNIILRVTRDYAILPAGLALLGFGDFLDSGGLFIYFTYTFVLVFSVFLGCLFLGCGIVLWKKMGAIKALASGVVVCLLFCLFGLKIGSLATSPRKQFYILADTIRPGDAMESVRTKLVGYEHFSSKDGHESFKFTPELGTTDVIVVYFDPKTSRVLEATFYPD